MSEQTPPIKKKRIRKPKPTSVEQVLSICDSMTLGEKIEVYNKIGDALRSQRALVQEDLNRLEGI